MAEKKNTTAKKSTAKSTKKTTVADEKVVTKKKSTTKKTEPKAAAKKTATKKAETKAVTKKATTKKVEEKKAPAKKSVKKAEVKKETIKEEKVDAYAAKRNKDKKKCKLVTWFNNLTLEQIIIGGVIVIAVLLIILIGVSTKNTKTKNGDDIVVSIDGKTITANDLYKELKRQGGQSVAINLIDEYILDKEYKTTDEMKKSAQSTIDNYKNTYGDSYNAFLEYNGIANDTQLKDLLIKNSKLTKVTESYIKENISEKEMKKYYDEKIVGDIEAKHILISTEMDEGATDEEKEAKEKEAKAKAEEIIEKLKKGEDFSKLAKKYSDDEGTKENGGDLGYFNTGDMVAEFEEAAYNLDVNEYTTKPVKTEYGYHIIMKTGQKDKPSFKKSKDTIRENLVEEKKEEDSTISVKAMVALRKKYNIKIKDKTIKKDYNSYIKNATTTTTTKASSN